MNGNPLLYWVVAYLLGAVPFGWIIVKLAKGIDIRYHASGRMGMSNVMRTAGTFCGILTAILDTAKGFAAVKIVGLICPQHAPWVEAIGGVLAVLGHIYSVFMVEKRRDGKLYLRGGAGGLTSVGAGIGLLGFPHYAIFVGPACLAIYLFIGYASLATASFNLFAAVAIIFFASRGETSWWYLLFAFGSELLVLNSLRPNFKRLKRGDERKTHLRIRWRKEDRE